MASNNDAKPLSLYDKTIQFLLTFLTRPDTHLGLNKQLINLLYNDVKNLTSILNCYVGPKCVASNNDAKPLSLYDIHFSQIFITRPDTDTELNKQLINLHYNDMKNLTSILYSYTGPK